MNFEALLPGPAPAVAAAAALALAWAADAAFGEPRNAWHPVAWLGRVLAALGRPLPGLPPALALVAGTLAWLVLAVPLVAAAAWVEAALLHATAAGAWVTAAAALALALLLKPCFAWRMLQGEVQAVDAALAQDLGAARVRLAGLVSRDTTALDADGVRETALQTLAENLNDSVVAPLLWWALAGLPGAVLYRYANTADAMWGYRGHWRWAGKFAARADDALSWLPARLSAVLLAPALALCRLPTLAREARRTPSPNGGWPMAALALRLHVRLRKSGVYALNTTAASPDAATLPLALARSRRAATAAFGLALLAGALAPGGLLR